jgi:hypothetical protein
MHLLNFHFFDENRLFLRGGGGLNKRTRYTQNTMPEDVTVLYDRFIDENFLQRLIQLIIFDEDNNEINFDKIRFAIFKVNNRNDNLIDK